MKHTLLISILLLLCLSNIIHAQQIVISGTVTDKTSSEQMVSALVTIRPEGENRIVKFAQTSAQGKFEIVLDAFLDNHTIHFSMMGFATHIVPLREGQTVYNAQLSEQATELKEVIVKAPNIHQRGDTITYMVQSFADAQDKSLADVLKKMPGIEVEKSGAIKYNGVSINKFYIEGKDMLGGRYGIATNNIHHKDVGSVEVMENHQPIKALEDISFSQNPGINIRLREDAKARWVGTVKAGAGFEPFLWNTEIAVMRFKKQSQTLNTYKTNNLGDDITRESTLFSIDDVTSQFGKNYQLQNYISVMPSRLREIDSDRSRFNKTHSFTTNNLWSLGKNYDLTSQISYNNNRLTSDNRTVTSYFLPDTTIVTDLEEHALNKENHLLGDITVLANTATYYFKNKLYADLRWSDVDMNISGTYPNSQIAKTPHKQVSNDLEILKRFGAKSYSINSFNLYQAKPQQLTVKRQNESQHQSINSSAFFTNTNTSLSFFVNPIIISMKLGVVGVIRSMESELVGVSDTLGGLTNDISMRYLNLYVSPEMEYKKSGFEAKLDVPISFIPYRYTNNAVNERHNEEKLFVSPRFYMRYHFTSRLSASVSGRYAQSPLQEQSFYEGLILNNYRNLSQGVVDYSTGNNKSINLSINYRNPLKTLFANLGVNRSWSYSPRVSNRYFINEYLLNTNILQDSYSKTWIVTGNISKGVDIMNSFLSLSSMLYNFDATLFQNGEPTPYSSTNWSIKPKITSKIATWCNASYELNFSKDWMRMKDTNFETSYNNLSQVVSINFTPSKTWYVQLKGEHYYNEITENNTKSLFLADAEFTYSFGSGWELNILAKNIFNQRVYAYSIHDGITAMSREYQIRPRNVMMGVFFRF